MKYMQNLAVILGIFFLLYFLGVKISGGYGTNFYFIWLMMGLALIAWAVCMKKGILIPHIPIWIRRICLALVCLGCLLFVLVEGLILSGFMARGDAGLDYVIVLGAQMKEHGPSRVL